MDEMDIEIMPLGQLMTNCYIISNHETKEAVIIDPADESDKIEAYIGESGLSVRGILLTHGHFDHINAAFQLRNAYHTKIYAYEEEREVLENAEFNCSLTLGGREVALAADVFLKDKDVISLAGLHIQVLHTPGHTKGSVCYYIRNHNVVVSGDTLFLESIGRTDMPTGNAHKLLESIRDSLLGIEDSVLVLPGHGDRTTIGYERKNNPFLIEGGYWE